MGSKLWRISHHLWILLVFDLLLQHVFQILFTYQIIIIFTIFLIKFLLHILFILEDFHKLLRLKFPIFKAFLRKEDLATLRGGSIGVNVYVSILVEIYLVFYFGHLRLIYGASFNVIWRYRWNIISRKCLRTLFTRNMMTFIKDFLNQLCDTTFRMLF